MVVTIPHGHFDGRVDDEKTLALTKSEWEDNNKLVAQLVTTEKARSVTATYANAVPEDDYPRCNRTVVFQKMQPYCLNPQVDGKQPSLADRIYHDEAKATAVTTSFITNVVAGRAVNRRINEDGKRADNDLSIPTETRIEINEDPGKSNTLTTFDKDNIAVGTDAVRYYWRKLTVRECARLQGFQDSYEFPVSDSRAYKGIGNSWQRDVIDHVFGSFDFSEEPYDEF